MRQTEDFLKLVDVVTRMRSSGLPSEIAEGAIRASWDEFKVRSQDIRYIAAAERLALHPPKEPAVETARASSGQKAPQALHLHKAPVRVIAKAPAAKGKT